MSPVLRAALLLACVAIVTLPLPAPGTLTQDEPAVKNIQLKKGFARVDSVLTEDDSMDRVRKQPCKVFSIRLLGGKTYQIDMVSNKIDTYLRLEDADNKEVAHDDDSGGVTNARIVFKCPQEGGYRIFATTSVGGTGPFRLTIQEK
jgi:serine protease Do